MPRAQVNKLYRTFVKGLVTEAGPLTYPENATTDENNCTLHPAGNRKRRLGFEFEDDYELSLYSIPRGDEDAYAMTEYVWQNVANDGDKTLLVHQVGTRLLFWDLSEGEPFSANLKSFSVNLLSFAAPGGNGFQACPVQMASGKGVLYVVGEDYEPFYITYNPDTDNITVKKIVVLIRDFKGVNDGLANDQEPTTLTALHRYNLQNQGWIDSDTQGGGASIFYYNSYGEKNTYDAPSTTVISDYYAAFNRYPSNNKQWFIGKAAVDNPDATPPYEAGDFLPELLNKFFNGNTHAPRGHYVVEAFNIDRSGVSGVPGLPTEVETTRPTSVAFFGGRAFFLHKSTVYFSQVLDQPYKAGLCFQEADPTSEDISDLIATDGGVVPIPGMGYGVKLVSFANGLVIFGNNGVWFLTGTDKGFSATDIKVSKINAIGTDAPQSVVEAEGELFWWADTGIMGMSQKSGLFGSVDGAFERVNISQTTIQSYINKADATIRRNIRGVYDPFLNRIQWALRFNQSIASTFSQFLNFDLNLKAFYPWSIAFGDGRPVVMGLFTTKSLDTTDTRRSAIRYIVGVNVNEDTKKFTIGEVKNDRFVDWEEFDGEGHTYLSFIESGYEIFEDAMREKEANYVFCYFNRSETEWVEDEDNNWVFDKPSSCTFQTKWDWTDSSVSGKWSRPIEAYRHNRLPLFDEDDPAFNNGYPVIVTKNKVRGNGKAMQFRFSNDKKQSDFDLLGWAVNVTGNTAP